MPPGAVPPGAMPGAVPPPPPGAVPPPAAQAFPDLTEGLVICPICRSPQTGRFCEECGYDYDLSTPSRRQAPAAGMGAPVPPPVGPPAPLNIPAAYGGTAPPAEPDGVQLPVQQPQAPAPAHTYGYPPSEGAFPEAPGREDSGPVYAGTGNRDFGTSFNLAPPMPPYPQPEAAQPQPQPVRTNWIAVVTADREYFTEMMARSGPEAAGLFFPPYCPERRIPLTGRGQLRIGRRSQHRGTVPEIDLSVPPEDPGASHQHALLAEQADGSWVLVDQDSTNGTTMNGGPEPVAPHVAVPLNDGDRIHVGAWTTITVHRA
ncbi:FHA domain-containing protein [Streptomyces kaniharaensis]|nr:FHA domain-containing protein [Streptomyces kaniharaensis]